MTDVFISYARANRNRVRIIALGLSAEGFSVWWDPEIKPGSKWNDAIRKSLEGAAAVVTCWSPQSIKSNWVVAETTHANNAKKLVPCVVKNCQPPIPFNMIQSADLSAWNGDADDADWTLFLRQVRQLVEAKRRAAGAIPPPGEAEGATGGAVSSAASPEPVVPQRYVGSTTRGRLGPRIGPMLFGAVAITALLTGGWWAIERGPLNGMPSAPTFEIPADETTAPTPTDPTTTEAPADPAARNPAPATTTEAPPPPGTDPVTLAATSPAARRMTIRATTASDGGSWIGYDLDTGSEIVAVSGDDRTQWGQVDFVLAGMRDDEADNRNYHFFGVPEGSLFAPTAATPSPTRAVCEGLAYSNQSVQVRETSIAGRAYCVRTNQGRIAYIYVLSGPGPVPGALEIDVTLLD